MRSDAYDILDCRAAALERDQPILAVAQDAMRGREHKIRGYRYTRAQRTSADDQDNVARDRLIGRRGAADHRTRGRTCKHAANNGGNHATRRKLARARRR